MSSPCTSEGVRGRIHTIAPPPPPTGGSVSPIEFNRPIELNADLYKRGGQGHNADQPSSPRQNWWITRGGGGGTIYIYIYGIYIYVYMYLCVFLLFCVLLWLYLLVRLYVRVY